MALSEEEQRLLAQMEAALAAEDPKLASTLRGTTRGRLQRRRAAVAGVGFFAGLALLLAGMQSHWVVSVFGFILMFVAAIVAISAWKAPSPSPEGDAPDHARTASARPGQTRPAPRPGDKNVGDKNFMDKMEERWRRRQDEGS